MKRASTISRGRCGLARFAAWVAATFILCGPAHAGAWLEAVFNPSPMIARGHLEGGINGEGAARADGKTPLMLAVEANDLEVIAYLLQHGADPDLRDAAGETAIDLAQRALVRSSVEMLNRHESEHPGNAIYYRDKTPTLARLSAGLQSGAPGCATPHSLIVRVADSDGRPLEDAPVRFAVEGGACNLLTQGSSPPSPTLLLRTDQSGECRANLRLSTVSGAWVHVTATAGVGNHVNKVKFGALTNDGAGEKVPTCFDPSDVQITITQGNEYDLSWQNNSDDQTAINVWIELSKGREVWATLPPDKTSAHLKDKKEWSSARE